MLNNATSETRALPADSLRSTVSTLYAGLAASLVAGLVVFLDQVTADSMTAEIRGVYPDYTADEVALEAGAMNAYFYVMCALGVIGWLWAVRAVRKNSRATHLVGTVILALALSAALVNLGMPMPAHTLWVNWLPSLVGVVAVLQLWRLAAAGHFRRP